MSTLPREATIKFNGFSLPSEKESTLKGKFASKGSKFLPFRVDPFSEGLAGRESSLEVTEVVSLVKMAENLTNQRAY